MRPVGTSSYRFRIELGDRPGALARVTDVLAANGGNVESIDLQQSLDGVAVDEIGVDAPEGWDMVGVAARIDALPDTRVLVQRRERHPGDPVVNALRWAKAMLDAGPADHELEMSRAILEITGASVAWSCPVEEGTASPIGRAAVEHGRPSAARADALPFGRETEVPPPYWIVAVADDPDDPGTIAFAVRPVTAPFSRSEEQRLEVLVRLRRTLLTRA